MNKHYILIHLINTKSQISAYIIMLHIIVFAQYTVSMFVAYKNLKPNEPHIKCCTPYINAAQMQYILYIQSSDCMDCIAYSSDMDYLAAVFHITVT